MRFQPMFDGTPWGASLWVRGGRNLWSTMGTSSSTKVTQIAALPAKSKEME